MDLTTALYTRLDAALERLPETPAETPARTYSGPPARLDARPLAYDELLVKLAVLRDARNRMDLTGPEYGDARQRLLARYAAHANANGSPVDGPGDAR